jgi:putative membrane protein
MGRWLLIRWISNAVALFVAAWLLSGVDYGTQWWTLLILAVLSIPFIVVTLGLFYFLINVLMLYLTDWLVPDFEIKTFWWGALAAIIVSFVNFLMHRLLPEDA